MQRRSKSPEIDREEIAKRSMSVLYDSLVALQAEFRAAVRTAGGYPPTIEERPECIEDRLRKLEGRVARLDR